MVKAFTSIAILVISIAAVKAQSTGPLDASKYPAPEAIPPIDSPEVKAWLKEIDLTGAPNIPLHKNEQCEKAIPGECRWTCDACPADDITFCPLPNTWGLTFDDGPNVATPKLLDYLKERNHKASFFLIGGNVLQLPDVIRREVAEGHHLASHTWSHHALTSLTNEQIVAEMKWTEKIVMDATGLRLKYMRPPFGDINNRVRFVLQKLGYLVVDWTGDEFDTNDWQIPDNKMTMDQVVGNMTESLDKYVKSDKSKGFYCLEHDQTIETVNAALRLIPLGEARNISMAPIPVCESDAFGYQGGSTAPNATSSAVVPTSSSTNGTKPTGSVTSSTSTPTTSKNPSAGVRSQALSMGGAVAALAMAVAFLA